MTRVLVGRGSAADWERGWRPTCRDDTNVVAMVGKSGGELYSGEAVEVENEDGEETRNPRHVASLWVPLKLELRNTTHCT